MKADGQRKRSFSSIMAGAQVIFGIIIFTSAWWIGDRYQTALYIYGFITVLTGIVTSLALTSGKK